MSRHCNHTSICRQFSVTARELKHSVQHTNRRISKVIDGTSEPAWKTFRRDIGNRVLDERITPRHSDVLDGYVQTTAPPFHFEVSTGGKFVIEEAQPRNV